MHDHLLADFNQYWMFGLTEKEADSARQLLRKLKKEGSSEPFFIYRASADGVTHDSFAALKRVVNAAGVDDMVPEEKVMPPSLIYTPDQGIELKTTFFGALQIQSMLGMFWCDKVSTTFRKAAHLQNIGDVDVKIPIPIGHYSGVGFRAFINFCRETPVDVVLNLQKELAKIMRDQGRSTIYWTAPLLRKFTLPPSVVNQFIVSREGKEATPNCIM